MNIDEINRQAYQFISVLNSETPNKESKEELKGSLAQTGPSVTLDNIIDNYIAVSSILPNGDNYIKSVLSNGKEYSFDKQNHALFRNFLVSIHKSHFRSLCSLSFIEEIAFKWIITVKQEGKSSIDFYYYLKEKVDSTVKKYRYYYPVFNLHTEKNFEIGNVQFTFFTKKQIEQFNGEDNNLYDFYKNILGRVYVSTSIEAERSKAKEVSFAQCCLAFDVLKIFICDLFHPTQRLYVDIEHRANFNYSDNYFSIINENIDSLNFTLGTNAQPLVLNDKLFINFQQKGIGVFSNFIKSKIDNELKAITVNAIRTFAIAVTNEDLYLRISLLLSVCEMILLKEDEKNYTSCLCQKRFIAILGNINPGDKEKAILVIPEVYILRNKYLHNGRKLPINLLHLIFFQQLIRLLLINIIRNSEIYSNKNALLDNYNFIDECKKESLQKKKSQSKGIE